MTALPALVAKFSGQFILHVTRDKGRRQGQVNLRLEGIPGSTRSDLLETAITMGRSKLISEGFHDSPTINESFSEELFKNVVSVQMQSELTPMPN